MKILFSLILCFVFSLSVVAADQLAKIAADYAAATNEMQKRAVCIALIDSNYIRMGSSIEIPRRVFQKDFIETGIDENGNKVAAVNFIPIAKSTNAMVSATVRGWYLALTYSDDGSIVKYYLTNWGKDSASRLPPGIKRSENSTPDLPVAAP